MRVAVRIKRSGWGARGFEQELAAREASAVENDERERVAPVQGEAVLGVRQSMSCGLDADERAVEVDPRAVVREQLDDETAIPRYLGGVLGPAMPIRAQGHRLRPGCAPSADPSGCEVVAEPVVREARDGGTPDSPRGIQPERRGRDADGGRPVRIHRCRVDRTVGCHGRRPADIRLREVGHSPSHLRHFSLPGGRPGLGGSLTARRKQGNRGKGNHRGAQTHLNGLL